MSSLPAGHLLVDRLPTLVEYQALRRSVDWRLPSSAAASVALDRSVLGVCVEMAGTAVGMARVVGDFALYLFIVDVVVHPDHQHHGFGRQMMHRLVELAEATAAPSIGLVAAPDVAGFYTDVGFQPTPDLFARWPL
jgi:GNAT superfamily N-acetyltransferase